MNVQLAEALAELDVLLERQILVAEEEHLTGPSGLISMCVSA
jgi:hypothetical protein